MTPRITIVGMGPGFPGHLTVEAAEVLLGAPVVYARTERHDVVSWLRERGKQVLCFDELYEQNEEFSELQEALKNAVLKHSELEPIVYAVPGNPLIGEDSVAMILEALGSDSGTVRLVFGAGATELAIQSAGMNPKSWSVKDFTEANQTWDASALTVVTAVDSRMAASELKIGLMEQYPETHPVVKIRGAGTARETLETLDLHEMDHGDDYDHETSVLVPSVAGGYSGNRLEDLLNIMKTLRSPEGCPWDQKQTHQTLLPSLIEEAYEVYDAIEQDDLDLMEEELGDLLLQIVFHAQIAGENGYFEMKDVISGICKKMIRRHPHVFADETADTAEEVLVNWEAIKKEEKKEDRQLEGMSRIPRQMPALMRSYKIQQKAADVGFDWDSVDGAIDKVREEFEELLELLDERDPDRMEDELGDLLFAVVNVARFLKVKPEEALRRTSDKFLRRFEYVENKVIKIGKKMQECPLEELDGYWDEAKNLEK